MVGEIRDRETAEIAVEAALTGHLVFSTLHTNDAPGAVTRLLDMGVEPFLVASAVEGVLAQRLVRRLCAACKKPLPSRATSCASTASTPTATRSTSSRRLLALRRQAATRAASASTRSWPITDEIRSLAVGRASADAIAEAAGALGDAAPARRGLREGPRRA